MARVTVVRFFSFLALGLTLTACDASGPDDQIFRIVLAPASDTLAPGATSLLAAEVSTEDGTAITGRTLTWASSRPEVATVSTSGLVTALSTGTATIEATADGRRGSAFIIVREPVAAVRLVPDVATIDIGDGFLAPRVELRDRFGNTVSDRLVTWQTSNPAIVTVNAFGEIAPIVEGDAVVTATSEGHSADIQVQVRRVAVGEVTIEPSSPLVFGGLSVQLRATVLRADGSLLFGRQVTWSTSDPAVLAVDVTGRLTGKGPGSATITASSEGVTATASVRVVESSAGLSAGGHHSCVLSASATAWCWGMNINGELGTTSTGLCSSYDYYYEYFPCARTPVRVQGSSLFREISAGESHTCAIALAGQVWCWGGNFFAELGTGSSQRVVALPQEVQTNATFEAITTGTYFTCGIASDRQAHCWGFNQDGQLGRGAVSPTGLPLPVSGGHSFVSLSAGSQHTCGVTVDGSIWCWGVNWSGQLGNGTIEPAAEPVQVSGGLTAVKVSAADGHTCALTVTNSIYCWGTNTEGQLGSSGGTVRTTPTLVSGTVLWKDLAAGGRTTCAIDQSERLHCWGANGDGQVGAGHFGSHVAAPTLVQTTEHFVSVSVKWKHACGRVKDGGVACWGSGISGELGLNNVFRTATPIRVAIPQ
jgi:alpha-tubulin suppressor-like RCC1 family protein